LPCRGAARNRNNGRRQMRPCLFELPGVIVRRRVLN
jgi:hypothetical protein